MTNNLPDPVLSPLSQKIDEHPHSSLGLQPLTYPDGSVNQIITSSELPIDKLAQLHHSKSNIISRSSKSNTNPAFHGQASHNYFAEMAGGRQQMPQIAQQSYNHGAIVGG